MNIHRDDVNNLKRQAENDLLRKQQGRADESHQPQRHETAGKQESEVQDKKQFGLDNSARNNHVDSRLRCNDESESIDDKHSTPAASKGDECTLVSPEYREGSKTEGFLDSTLNDDDVRESNEPLRLPANC